MGSLPKTMDETYERIFSYIPDEEKELVRHTLHWACFHDFLWKGLVPLPANLLIDSFIAIDQKRSRLSSDEYLYDLETLRESCGCLVSFAFDEEGQSQSTNIAHYTVREFLESDRLSRTSWFSIEHTACYRSILAFVMEYAITSEPIKIPEFFDGPAVLMLGSTSSFNEYCLATSVRSLCQIEELVEPRLAFRFLDPLEAHFEALSYHLLILESNGDIEEVSSTDYSTGPWHVNWYESTKRSKATILANLLLMKCLSLAKDFLLDLDLESVSQEILCGSITPLVPWWDINKNGSGKFKCNLVEFLAEMGEFDKDMLDFFQREARGLICYSDLLPHYMPRHSCESMCGGLCALSLLLQLGANPDPKGFVVTPLQVAIFARDLTGVRALLEAGADSNNTGDEQSVKQQTETPILGPYCHLHGLTPLHILRHLGADPRIGYRLNRAGIDLMNGATTDDIERLLLDYNASTESMENRQ